MVIMISHLVNRKSTFRCKRLKRFNRLSQNNGVRGKALTLSLFSIEIMIFFLLFFLQSRSFRAIYTRLCLCLFNFLLQCHPLRLFKKKEMWFLFYVIFFFVSLLSLWDLLNHHLPINVIGNIFPLWSSTTIP